jgi:hypothetical protein
VGIRLSGFGNQIGGATAEARNVISGNSGGVEIRLALREWPGNRVEGNFIGTDVSGGANLGNTGTGVQIFDAFNNRIGGTEPGTGNTIAFNGAGAHVVSGTGNVIRNNSIFSNTGLGINLGNDVGVTPNDPSDGDTGPNNLQNYPVITAASSSGDQTVIRGAFNGVADTTFTLEFFANATCNTAGYGAGGFGAPAFFDINNLPGGTSGYRTVPTGVTSADFNGDGRGVVDIVFAVDGVIANIVHVNIK